MIILEIKNLSASYEDGRVLDNVSFTVEQGEVLCIVGESGSGKSTLTRALSGHEGLIIQGGSIIFEGRNITCLEEAKRRSLMGSSIGIIPQNPAASFNPIRSFDKQFKEMFKSHKTAYDRDMVLRTLEKMGLNDPERILRSRPFEMSGGMNQRIAISAAMMLFPKLLICDEITSALDVTTASLVTDEVIKLCRLNNTSVIMITHNLGLAKNVADRIGIMYDGSLIEIGDKNSIIYDSKQEHTQRLINSAPRLKV
ncbi:MAG: ABC transporter ATP-binding protein [Butyrivibrio sp.]|nr:ABC transporter ATP-binding protein [Butyrivibrio sp.]